MMFASKLFLWEKDVLRAIAKIVEIKVLLTNQCKEVEEPTAWTISL